MKKMNLTKLMAVLVVLCLITSTFVGSTLAKYVTSAEGNDTARVAKFGVVLTAESDIFAPEYEEDDENGTGSAAVMAKLVDDVADDVVAPGTKGTMTAFTIDGAPEVDVMVEATLSKETELSMVTLPAGTGYNDWTTAIVDDKYNVDENYYPVVWTLKQGEDVKATGNLAKIEEFLTKTFSKKYEVESAEFEALKGTWTLDWEWAFYVDEATDKKDTSLGQVAAGVDTIEGTVLNETFDFKITVTQVD